MAKTQKNRKIKAESALRAILGFIWEHPSLIMFCLLVGEGFLSYWIFDRYYFKIDERRATVSQVAQIDKNALAKMTAGWQKRDETLGALAQKIYPDPFITLGYKPNSPNPNPGPSATTASSSAPIAPMPRSGGMVSVPTPESDNPDLQP